MEPESKLPKVRPIWHLSGHVPPNSQEARAGPAIVIFAPEPCSSSRFPDQGNSLTGFLVGSFGFVVLSAESP